MQAWQIIVASAAAASIAAAALFLPGAIGSPAGAATLFQTYWPGVAIVWLAAYSVAALALSTATAVGELHNADSGRARPDWPLRYLIRLGTTQYFSAVLVLLALGLLPIAVATEPFFSVPGTMGSSPALIACAGAILVGVLGWLTATIAAAFRAPMVWATDSAGPETELLQEIVELLRSRPVEPISPAAEFAEQLRQRDRATLEAIKELAAAVGRVRGGISEIQNSLQHRETEPAGVSGSMVPAEVANASGELRAATAALVEAVTKLDDIAAGLAALPPIGMPTPVRGSMPTGSRSQLSSELQELLRDMATEPAPHQEGSR